MAPDPGIPTILALLAQHPVLTRRTIRDATGWTAEHTDEVMGAIVTLGFATPRGLGEWKLTVAFRTQAGAMTLGGLIVLLTDNTGVKAA